MFAVPTCLHSLEQRSSVISNPVAQFSDKAAVKARLLKLPHVTKPPTKANCETEPQDLYPGGGEATGGLAGMGAVNIA